MPLYYFDIDDGNRLYPDDEGLELPDDEAAREEARNAIGEMAAEYIPGEGSRKTLSMRVRNANGVALLELSVVFTLREPEIDGEPRHQADHSTTAGDQQHTH
jgi:hypothetical protein